MDMNLNLEETLKKYLRLLAMTLALAMIVAACGGGDEPTDTTEAAAETTAAETTAAETTAAETTMTETTAAEETEPAETTAADGEFSGDSVAAENCDYGGKIESIEATAQYEVVFNLCSPDPAFLQKMAFVPFGVQPAEHLEATGGAPLENPIGTGPFMLDSWNRGSDIVFSANPDYWGEAPSFQTLVFRWATESTSRIVELQSGNAHYITNLSAPDYQVVEGDPNMQLLEDQNPNIFYIGMTNTHAPFDNPDVRRAVAMGINRQRIVDTFYPQGSEAADYFTPCSIENGCAGDPWYEFDPEAGRQLLADAGFPDGFDTTIYLRDVFRVYLPEPQNVAQEIQTQLADNLGINAEIQVMESGAFIEESNAGNLEGIHLLGWGADYPHVTNFLDAHFAGTTQFGEMPQELVDLLAEGAATIDPAEAEPIYAEANNILRETVPMVPIAHGAAANAALAALEGANVPPFGAPQFDQMTPEGDTLVFVQNAEPISLFCADETDGESLSACEQVLEPLYQYDVEGTPVPALAEECAPNEDGTQWTCTLREGVTFHDGSDFDASDVIATWATGIDAANPNHVGNSGVFFYYEYLWGGLMNAPPAEDG